MAGVTCCGNSFTNAREYLDHIKEITLSVQYEMFHAAMQEIKRLENDGKIDNVHANRIMNRVWQFTLSELQNKF